MRSVAARYLFERRDVRGVDVPLGSATSTGVHPRSDLSYEVWNPGEDTSGYKLVEPGDFVIGLRSFQHGFSYSSVRVKVSPAYTVFRARSESSVQVEPRYFAHYFRSLPFVSLLGEIGQGIRQGKVIDYEAFEAIQLPVPDSGDQRRIAAFLDDQVARIDNIIASRRRQREHVGEELQAQVDLAAGVGSMRRLAPLLYLLRDGTHTPPARVDEGVPLLTAKNVRTQSLSRTDSDTLISVADADVLDRSFKPSGGDVLLSVKGSVGNVAIVPSGFQRFQIERNLALMRPVESALTSVWLYWSLRSRRVQDQLQLMMGFSAQPGVYLGDLGSLTIRVPDAAYQKSAGRELDDRSAESMRLASALDRSVMALEELKRSLITAAVTGEFDVVSTDGSRVCA